MISDRGTGHYIRYHSECSVIANNFLMTKQHEEKSRELDNLLDSSPTELLAASPEARYIMVRLGGLYMINADGSIAPTPVEYLKQRHPKLVRELTFGESLPPEYELVEEIRIGDERDFAYASLYRLNR